MTKASSPALQELEVMMAGPIGRVVRPRDLSDARRAVLGPVLTAEGRTYPALSAREAAGLDLKAEAAKRWEQRREIMVRRPSNWPGLALNLKSLATALMLADRHFNS